MACTNGDIARGAVLPVADHPAAVKSSIPPGGKLEEFQRTVDDDRVPLFIIPVMMVLSLWFTGTSIHNSTESSVADPYIQINFPSATKFMCACMCVNTLG